MHRPSNRYIYYMQSLCNLLDKMYVTYKIAVIWITGDLNLPNVDWVNNTVSSYLFS